MDVLVLQDCVLMKSDQPALGDDVAWRDLYELD